MEASRGPETSKASNGPSRRWPGATTERISGRRRVHCSYHKCLTVYFQKVFSRLHRPPLGPRGGYRHFDSRLDAFYDAVGTLGLASVNNHVVDLDRFDDVRVTRFVRDPRDLVVSGYFYHRRAAEAWCRIVDPGEADWRVVNGTIPTGFEAVSASKSFAEYLNDVSIEEGLLAELEFRRRHFESMRAWPDADPRVRLFRYEDVLGNEVAAFDEILRFFEIPTISRRVGLFHARRFRAANRSDRSDHIRDPRAGQWREIFTSTVSKRFDDEYGDLVDRLGYPRR